MSFKTINRTISETGKNTAMFSMVNDEENPFRDKLTNAQLTRWIINFMGYTSTPDKTKIKSFKEIKNIEKYDGHKGWLYSIGGLHYKTDNLFKTLLLNLVLVHPSKKFTTDIQSPAWENTPEENIKFYLNDSKIDNLARLYTDYSRAIRISKTENEYGRYLEVIQLPLLDKKENYLECMTIWKNIGKNDDIFVPVENNPHESLWRNFGMIYNKNHSLNKYKTPYIVDWMDIISGFINDTKVKLVGMGIKSDSTSSNSMKNEIYDELIVNYEISNNSSDKLWISRIDDAIGKTKRFLETDYFNFANELIKIQKSQNKKFKNETNIYLESLYYKIDQPFRDWLSSIEYSENKDEKIDEWFKIFKKIVMEEVEKICSELSDKYYIGVEFEINKKKQYRNVALILNDLKARINKEL